MRPKDLLWLKDSHNPKTIKWIKKQNAVTQKKIVCTKTYQKLKRICEKADKASTTIESKEFKLKKGFWYRVYTDSEHKNGLLQIISTEKFKGSETQWQTILDLDKLSKKENTELKFVNIYIETFHHKKYALVSLSHNGTDEVSIRELNLRKKEIDADGFYIPLSRISNIEWITHDSIMLGSTYGDNCKTKAQYPNKIRLLKRNEPFSKAKTIFEVDDNSCIASGSKYNFQHQSFYLFVNVIDFYHAELFLSFEKNLSEKIKLPIPADAANIKISGDFLFFSLNSSWTINATTYQVNSVMALDLNHFLKDTKKTDSLRLSLVFQKACDISIEKIIANNNNIFILTCENLSMYLYEIISTSHGFRHNKIQLPEKEGDYNNISRVKFWKDQLFFTYETFLTPPKLYAYTPTQKTVMLLDKSSEYASPKNYVVNLFWAKSVDGTPVPYHTVSHKTVKFNGDNPTLLYGYGGFHSTQTPSYIGNMFSALLDYGFVYIHAHIRGGGEYGAQWGQAGSGYQYKKSIDDFIAIAENIIYHQKITNPSRLSIFGGSNGGLLVGAAMTQRPELFKAVISECPLLDMLLYHKLYIGMLWLAQYGNPDDPDPKKKALLKQFSPLQNVSSTVKYPAILLLTNRYDDRTHPYHPRAMTQQLQTYGNKAFYYEEKTGGHDDASFESSIRQYTFLHLQLLRQAQAPREKRSREDVTTHEQHFFGSSEKSQKQHRCEHMGLTQTIEKSDTFKKTIV